MNKKEHLKHLESNKTYQKILKMFKSDDERHKAQALAEELFLKMMEGFTAARDVSRQNPDKFVEVVSNYIDKDKDGK